MSLGQRGGGLSFPLSRPSPQGEASASHTGHGPTTAEEQGGTEGQAGWVVGGWQLQGDCCQDLPRGMGPMAPKLGPSPSPGGRVLLQRKELAKITSPPRQPTAGPESGLLYDSGAPGQWTSPAPFSAPELCPMAATHS